VPVLPEVVLALAHALIGLAWTPAFALGAIVSPTDALAATTIMERLHVPRRLVAILEGESLVNDASGLVAYRLAVAAALTGSFSILSAAGHLVLLAAGGRSRSRSPSRYRATASPSRPGGSSSTSPSA